MSFDTPNGIMTFRRNDHQAVQALYHIKLEKKEGFDYPVPTLVREINTKRPSRPL